MDEEMMIAYQNAYDAAVARYGYHYVETAVSYDQTDFTLWWALRASMRLVLHLMARMLLVLFWISLPAAAIASIVCAGRITTFLDRLGESARDWYDDQTLRQDSDCVMNLSHAYESSRRAMANLSRDLWYNETVDRLQQLYQTAWHTIDDIISALPKVFAIIAVISLAYHWAFQATDPVKMMTWPELADAGFRVPLWILDKSQGRNSYAKREAWAAAFSHKDIGSPLVIEAMPEPTSTQSSGIRDLEISALKSITETIALAPVPEPMGFEPVTETVSMPELSLPALKTDYWAPPKGKTNIGDKMVWCRECRQFHCCELPY